MVNQSLDHVYDFCTDYFSMCSSIIYEILDIGHSSVIVSLMHNYLLKSKESACFI